jgi:hypothetical protein
MVLLVLVTLVTSLSLGRGEMLKARLYPSLNGI